MKFKSGKGIGRYDVIVAGEVIGEVWKTYKHGYEYWKNNKAGKNILFSTRKEAGENLAK